MAGNIAVGIALVSALAADEMPAPPQGDMTGSWQVSIVGGPNPVGAFEFIGKMSGPGLISGTMLMTTGPGTFKFTAQRAE